MPLNQQVHAFDGLDDSQAVPASGKLVLTATLALNHADEFPQQW